MDQSENEENPERTQVFLSLSFKELGGKFTWNK
jgi:hypothetical protein